MKRFELKEEHIKLLRNMYVGWSNAEFGAPEIDPKRPYGNSYVYGDMIEILGWSQYNIKDNDVYEQVKTLLYKLHQETQIALQIILATAAFIPGVYEAGEYSKDWKLIVDKMKDEING